MPPYFLNQQLNGCLIRMILTSMIVNVGLLRHKNNGDQFSMAVTHPEPIISLTGHGYCCISHHDWKNSEQEPHNSCSYWLEWSDRAIQYVQAKQHCLEGNRLTAPNPKLILVAWMSCIFSRDIEQVILQCPTIFKLFSTNLVVIDA